MISIKVYLCTLKNTDNGFFKMCPFFGGNLLPTRCPFKTP